MLDLPDLQRAFLRAIADGDATDAPTRAAGVTAEIDGRGALGPRDRLAIYARMYGARLVDALGEDYPRVATVLGWDRFREIALAYVAAHPSRHPSLRWLGARFPEFLASTPLAAEPGYLADLARLEWARVMVFDAPDVEILSVDDLRRLPPEAWGGLCLRHVPGLETLRVDWPVQEIWAALESGAPRSSWQRGELWLRVWRQDDRVFQAAMDPAERIALTHVRAGDDFGTLCDGLATALSSEEAAGAAGALVLRWIADELLCADHTRP